MKHRNRNVAHKSGFHPNHFAQIPATDIQRSQFDRSHRHLTTLDAGRLVPFFVDEVLPGDTFNLKCSLLARMTTPVTPVMDNIHLETFFFFVPNRLIWSHWEAMNGDQSSGPSASTDYLVPMDTKTSALNSQSIGAYMGIPSNVSFSEGLPVSDLPLRAYSLIFNEWFRNENLSDAVNIDEETGRLYVGDETIGSRHYGSQAIQNFLGYDDQPLYRSKRHDYFTSALPWTQKGADQGVTISLGSSLPITATGVMPSQVVHTNNHEALVSTNQSGPFGRLYWHYDGDPEGSGSNLTVSNLSSSGLLYIGGNTGWTDPASVTVTGSANLESATAITINDLRQAFQIQKLFERDARGGTRYTEILRSHFRVISPDARLQRPEYLGGSSSRINVLSVAQNSATSSTSPQGNLAAYAVGGDVFHGFTKSFVEHGWIIGIVNLRADITYQQGLNRMWSRRSRFDFYWPSLAHLGEQAILNKEIFASGIKAQDEAVFGYQERFAEYRYFPSIVSGKTNSLDPQTLDIWHVAQKFDSLPKLNDEFIKDTASYQGIQRVLAVQDEPQFILDSWFELRCVRPMPVYSVPGLVDHF